ncbi:MAG: sigma-70 family RNA polymerase sigma factor [Bacteroidales bacterium]|nr:sigma-70 family RNA polymerase sigma factor [Bacteroidales bacterium]
MKSYSEQQNRVAGFLAREYGNLISYVKKNWQAADEADAEDIVQDVVLNLFTKVDFNAPIENLFAYVYRSLKNKIIDLTRKRREDRLDDYEDEDSGENLILRRWVDETEDPDEKEEQEQMLQLMLETIDDLRPDQQEIIVATELEGYTFEELSQEWGIPIGTLLSRKHRAMATLQKLMNMKIKN